MKTTDVKDLFLRPENYKEVNLCRAILALCISSGSPFGIELISFFVYSLCGLSYIS